MTTVLTDVEAALRALPDPEIPVITIADLGILRDVEVDESARRVRVVITPTYSGCPAMTHIHDEVVRCAERLGYAAEVQTVLSPPWSTNDLTEQGAEKLRAFGIAPPSGRAPGGPVPVTLGRVACPHCGSTDTSVVSPFGSTACKALRRCESCREPFDEFKVI